MIIFAIQKDLSIDYPEDRFDRGQGQWEQWYKGWRQVGRLEEYLSRQEQYPRTEALSSQTEVVAEGGWIKEES